MFQKFKTIVIVWKGKIERSLNFKKLKSFELRMIQRYKSFKESSSFKRFKFQKFQV